MNSINWQNNYQRNQFCKFLNSGYADADKKGPAVYPASSSNRESENQASNSITNFENDFSISPNPTKSVITLVQKGDFNLMQISEMNGKLVFESALNTYENSQTFDLAILSNGIYMISLISDFKTVRTKLIINK